MSKLWKLKNPLTTPSTIRTIRRIVTQACRSSGLESRQRGFEALVFVFDPCFGGGESVSFLRNLVVYPCVRISPSV